VRTCAFLTLEDPGNYVIDDDLATGPLASLGYRVVTVPWSRPGTRWGDYDAVVIRSTWDYPRDPKAFLSVLGEIEASGTPLFNPLELVRWNIRKTYLRDLADRGVPVVPTVWRERLGAGDLARLLSGTGWREMVVKPVLGASAGGAYRVREGMGSGAAAAIETYFMDRALMAQPFLDTVASEGEFSLFYFNGEFSHAILKTPRASDFRVQEEHGGTIRSVSADRALRDAGARSLRALDTVPLYARADLIRAPDADLYWLMELELVEPSLYLRMDPAAPGRFARALGERLEARDGLLPEARSGDA
jgi:glutathione synthase/RimK-type ligase-like ATP-grasp enzyme